jgi:hypothetical protein
VTGPEYGPPPGPQYPQNPQYSQNPQYAPGPQYAPPVGPGAPGVPYAQAPAPQKSMKRRRVVALVVLVIVVAGIGILAYQSAKTSPDAAGVGDCVSKGSAEDIKVVNCTSASAAYKVLGKVENKTQVDFDLSSKSICSPFTGAQSAFWKGEVGKPGYVLCLGAK